MNQREKRLLIAFISVAVLGLGWKFGKPIVDPLFNTDEQINFARGDLDALIEEHDKLEADLRKKYAGYISRTKTTKPEDARDDLYDCISKLVGKAKLREPRISPKEPRTIDKRSKVVTITVSVSAMGSFRQCVDFVRLFYRIPYIARFNSLKFEPTSARQRKGHDEVKLAGEIEVLVLPDEKLLELKTGKQPDYIKKYSINNLAKLNSWKPFTPYEKPTPPPAPKTNRPSPTPTPPPRPQGPPQWDDGSEWLLKMVMRYGVDEVRLSNIVDESTIHIAEGEEFDGGTLVLVSALGVVSFKEDHGYYVYPLGQYVSDAIPLQDANDWPEIQVAMLQYFDAEDRRIAIEEAERKATEARRKALGAVDGDDESEDDFVGPPSDVAGVDQDANSDGLATAKSLLEQMGIAGTNRMTAPDGTDTGSNGIELDATDEDTDVPDATSNGLNEQSGGSKKQSGQSLQPSSGSGVETNAGKKSSNETKGRRTTPRSFRSRRTPGIKTATPKPQTAEKPMSTSKRNDRAVKSNETTD